MNGNNSTFSNETLAWTTTPAVPVSTRITLYCILLFWSLLGNVLVIAVVYYNQNLRAYMNYLMVNMAVSDLLVPLVAMPRKMSMHSETNGTWSVDGPLVNALCKLMTLLSHISPFVSCITLAIIAFQRFTAVVHPHRGHILSRKTRWIVMSFPWLVAVALYTPYLNMFRLTNEYGYAKCSHSLSPTFVYSTSQVIYFSTATVLGFVLPLIVIIILYITIIYKLRRSLDDVRDMIEQEMIRSRQRRDRRIFSMLITIIVLFTMCWCPFFTFILLSLHGHLYFSSAYWNILKLALGYVWYFHAAINPCIYFVFLKDFRQGLKRLCCRKGTLAVIEPIPRRPRTPGGDGHQDPVCTLPHINTTSV